LRFEVYPMPSDKQIWYLSILLLLLGMLLHLGMQPLFLEEPRRAMIAMEMLERNNWWLPTELGDYYYNKPPLFNWVIMGFSYLTGGVTEWSLRLPTVSSVWLTMWLIYQMGKRYMGLNQARISALFFAANGSILLFFSTLGEIDLFYALLSFCGFAALFHFQQQRRYLLMFIVFYGCHALGVLTKGLPSLVFIALSLPAWLWYKKELKQLFSWSHVGGVAVFTSIVGGYLLLYHQYNSISLLLPAWLGQAGERTVAAQGWSELFSHLIIFPLDTLKDLLPISLFLPLLWKKDAIKNMRQHDWLVFAVLIIAVNYPVYWISPGSRQRYLYMFYPLFANILAFLSLTYGTPRYMQWLMKFIVPILALGSLWLPLNGVSVYVSLLLFVSLSLVTYYVYKKPESAPIALIITMAIIRIGFDLVIIPERANESQADQDRLLATKIHDIVGTDSLAVYQYDRISFTTVYYLNRQRPFTLKRDYRPVPGQFYLAEEDCLERAGEIRLRFEYQQKPYILFRLLE
jgi:4-amino-4-deoxy-L-arabinose transferase-like glycosyltransferase